MKIITILLTSIFTPSLKLSQNERWALPVLILHFHPLAAYWTLRMGWECKSEQKRLRYARRYYACCDPDNKEMYRNFILLASNFRLLFVSPNFSYPNLFHYFCYPSVLYLGNTESSFWSGSRQIPIFHECFMYVFSFWCTFNCLSCFVRRTDRNLSTLGSEVWREESIHTKGWWELREAGRFHKEKREGLEIYLRLVVQIH